MNKEKEDIYLSLVIPAYNESLRLGKTLEDAFRLLNEKNFRWEIIVVDDGSQDNTSEVASKFLSRGNLIIIRNERNRGKGYTVRRGTLKAEGKYILFSDADESTPLEEMDKLLRYVDNGYDIAIGSRAIDRSMVEVRQSWWRERMGRIFNFFVRIFVLQGFKDTQCGFKCFKKEAAKKIFSKQLIEGFSFDVETIYLAHKFNYKVIEIPVRWINSPRSTVSPIRDSLRMFRDLLKIRINDLKGKYKTENAGQIE